MSHLLLIDDGIGDMLLALQGRLSGTIVDYVPPRPRLIL